MKALGGGFDLQAERGRGEMATRILPVTMQVEDGISDHMTAPSSDRLILKISPQHQKNIRRFGFFPWMISLSCGTDCEALYLSTSIWK